MEDQIKSDLKQAQLNRDEIRVSTLRLLLSEVNNERIKKGAELSSTDIVSVVARESKKRKEAAEAFRSGGREEQASKEESELEVLKSYLPEQLSTEELTKIVTQTITELGASSPADMGKVIGIVMGKVGQSAEGGVVSQIVREKLTNS